MCFASFLLLSIIALGTLAIGCISHMMQYVLQPMRVLAGAWEGYACLASAAKLGCIIPSLAVGPFSGDGFVVRSQKT